MFGFRFAQSLPESTHLQPTGIFLESFLNEIDYLSVTWLKRNANAVVPLVTIHRTESFTAVPDE